MPRTPHYATHGTGRECLASLPQNPPGFRRGMNADAESTGCVSTACLRHLEKSKGRAGEVAPATLKPASLGWWRSQPPVGGSATCASTSEPATELPEHHPG